MRLYHGSNQQILEIDLKKSKDHKDFGRGFYMTQDFSRAVAMAQRTTSIEGTGSPEVTPYLFNPKQLPADVKIKEFKGRTAEWALFILENRDKARDVPFVHGFDIVIGPVADAVVDSVLLAYRKRYGDDFRNPEHLRGLAPQLKFPGTEYIQYCFCTQKGIEQLKLDL